MGQYSSSLGGGGGAAVFGGYCGANEKFPSSFGELDYKRARVYILCTSGNG